MQYHIILLLVIFYRIACVRWARHRQRAYMQAILPAPFICNSSHNSSSSSSSNTTPRILFFRPHLTIYLILSTLRAHLCRDVSFSVCHFATFFSSTWLLLQRFLHSDFKSIYTLYALVFLHRYEIQLWQEMHRLSLQFCVQFEMQQINLNWRPLFHSFRSI